MLLLSSSSFAQDVQTVLIRGKHFRANFIEEKLPNLTSENSFEGEYFKIVEGKSEQAVSLAEPDSSLRLKAATTYFHLNRVRDFWVNTIGSKHVETLPPLTIRLEMSAKFSNLGHYERDATDEHELQFNDALSIPAWKQEVAIDVPENERWNNEIWFRPKKKILSSELPSSGLRADGNPLTKYVEMLSQPVKMSVVNRFIQTTLMKIFMPAQLQTPYQESVLRTAGTLAITSLILEASKHTDKLFLEKYYYLDTAMIPEIIYHEFSHVALSDHLVLSMSTPVLEGMADYFSASFSNNPRMADKIKKYSLSMPKNAKNKTNYHSSLESNAMANSDFVLSVLWSVRETLPEIADQLIYNARKYLATSSSDIRHDLVTALLESCSEVSRDPFLDRIKLREIFLQRGI